jgi:hypothetical protein
MSSDSLFGGGDDTVAAAMASWIQAIVRLLDALLADFVGGPAVDFDGGQLLSRRRALAAKSRAP